MTTTYGPLINIPGGPTTTYSGSWIQWGGASYSAGSFCGWLQLSANLYETCTFTFTGTRLVVYMRTASDQGTVDFSPLGTGVSSYNLNTPSTVMRQPVFDSGVLSAGSHSITLTHSAGAYNMIDSFEVTEAQDYEILGLYDGPMTFSGGWTSAAGAQYYENEHQYTGSGGNTCTVPFSGTQIIVYASTSNNQGQMSAAIDGDPSPPTVDNYSASQTYQTPVWTSPVLSAGSHTLVLTALGTHDGSSGGNYIDLSFFAVVPAGVVNQTIAGLPFTVAVAAPAGSVSAVKNVSVAGIPATVSTLMPAGSVHTGSNLSGPVAQVATQAPVGSVSASAAILGTPGTITVSAPAGSVHASVSVAGGATQVALAAPVGSVSTTSSVNVVGSIGLVSISMPPGSVSAGGAASVTGLPGVIYLAAPAGSISAGCSIAGTTATLTIAAPAGTVVVFSNVALAGVTGRITFAAPRGSVVTTGFGAPSKRGSVTVTSAQGFTAVTNSGDIIEVTD